MKGLKTAQEKMNSAVLPWGMCPAAVLYCTRIG
jgi:hypothetical protein